MRLRYKISMIIFMLWGVMAALLYFSTRNLILTSYAGLEQQTIAKIQTIFYSTKDIENNQGLSSIFNSLKKQKSAPAGYSLVNDTSGKPTALLKTVIPGNIYAEGVKTTHYFGLFLLVYSICFILLLWLMLRNMIIKRIEDLNTQFDNINANRIAAAKNQLRLTDEVSYVTTLYHQATHDPLTGLANRNLLYQVFHYYVKKIKGKDLKILLLFIDLDYFKRINDTLGHEIGDKVLVQTANRLKSSLRKSDLAVRLGGDEFVVMLFNVNYDIGRKITDRLYKTINQPLFIDNHDIYISSSMGVAIYPDDGKHIETLLKKADITLYDVKEKGRSHYKFFSHDLILSIQETHRKEISLQHAIDNNEFCLLYQPIYDARTKEIIALEALIRWNHPEKGLLSPVDIIPLAEKTGLIHPIGKWVLYTACRQAKIWHEKGIAQVPVTVNISTFQTRDTSLGQLVMHTLEQTGLEPQYLELELTETGFTEITADILLELQMLKSKGIELAVDDFGTGYSGLGYLKKLPVNKLKIDITFIRDVMTNADDRAITLAIITLAHQLNLRAIAEGVETKEQYDFLCAHRIDAVQGHYFSKPLNLADCERLLESIKIEA